MIAGYGRQRGQVLIILLGSMFFGGAIAAGVFTTGQSLKDLGKQVKAIHLDDQREDRVLDIFDRWAEVVKAALKRHERQTGAFEDLVKDRDATTAQFEQEFFLQRSDMVGTEDRVLSFRDELRATLQKDEWERLFAAK